MVRPGHAVELVDDGPPGLVAVAHQELPQYIVPLAEVPVTDLLHPQPGPGEDEVLLLLVGPVLVSLQPSVAGLAHLHQLGQHDDQADLQQATSISEVLRSECLTFLWRIICQNISIPARSCLFFLIGACVAMYFQLVPGNFIQEAFM